jgi:hypothetical protein
MVEDGLELSATGRVVVVTEPSSRGQKNHTPAASATMTRAGITLRMTRTYGTGRLR